MLNLFPSRPCQPFVQGTYLLWVHLYLPFRYYISQKGDYGRMKLTLLLEKILKNLTDMLLMGLKIWGENQDVI